MLEADFASETIDIELRARLRYYDQGLEVKPYACPVRLALPFCGRVYS